MSMTDLNARTIKGYEVFSFSFFLNLRSMLGNEKKNTIKSYWNLNTQEAGQDCEFEVSLGY